MKKPILISISVIAVAALGFGVYFAWKKSGEILTPPTIGPAAEDYGQNDSENQGKFTAVANRPVFDYWIVPGNGLEEEKVFYVSSDGLIVKSENGAEEEISAEPIKNLQAVKHSRDGKMVLVKFGNLNSPDFSIFSVSGNLWEPLVGVTAADFSPDGSQIAYFEDDGDLMVKNFGSGKKPTKITKINQKDFDLSWVSKDKILMVSKPSHQYVGEIWAIDVKNKTLNLLSSGRGLMVNWSFDGEWGVMFANAGDRSPILKLVDKNGKVLADFKFAVPADKCFISKPKIYCAVSQERSSIDEPVLPDDYLQKAVYFRDFIYEIDTRENASKLILAQRNPGIDAYNLSLSGGRLFFINRYDNKLYSFEL